MKLLGDIHESIGEEQHRIMDIIEKGVTIHISNGLWEQVIEADVRNIKQIDEGLL